MDNKNMTEKESLELITHMIQNAKYKMAENAGMPFLFVYGDISGDLVSPERNR